MTLVPRDDLLIKAAKATKRGEPLIQAQQNQLGFDHTLSTTPDVSHDEKRSFYRDLLTEAMEAAEPINGGEPDKTVQIVEDDIATDLEEVTIIYKLW